MQKLDVLDTKARRDHELKPASDDDGWVSDYRKSHKTTPSVDASAVYGREEDLDRLVKSLLEPYVSDKRSNYSVVGIMGSGGTGKTTLAKLVLENKRVVKEFSLRSWACVSDGAFNAERALKDLYTYARDEEYNGGFALLQKKVDELVNGKKFLFVLDDVWTDKDKDWEDLRSPFHSCGVGSIFLVTTRNRRVLDMMHSRVTHTLGPLADADMWKLFSEKAFTERNSNDDSIKIGHDIVNKCKGVPLSAKVLGRMLHSQVDKRKWESVLESSYWDLPVEGDEDLPALRISHYHLPFHLKLCFEYLSLFPSDHIFDKRYLVQLWIAEGFVRPERGRYLEDIGSEYYEELQERSLIEADDKMHDLAHSLACKLSKKFNSRVVNESDIDKQIVIRARHVLFDGRPALPLASVELHTCVYLIDYGRSRLDASVFGNLPRLKYLHVLDLHRISMKNMSDNFFSEFRHLRYLRLGIERMKKLPLSIHRLQSLQTLILAGCRDLEDIRAEVVNLVSLIHLDLSHTRVSTLPMWLCNLPCLRTLVLFACTKLREIPTEIEKLQTLRELDLRLTKILFLPDSLCNIANLEALYLSSEKSEILPRFIGRLTQLKVMPDYKVGIEEGKRIGELQNLRNLTSLRLCCLENVKSVKEAKMAALENKKSLTFLSFAWNKAMSIEDEDHGKSDCEVLEALQPHPTKIESLLFKRYKGEEFPSWIRGSHFSSLKRLRMIGMKRLTRVAQATFNSLKDLYIGDCPSMEAVLIAAPMLEGLSVESCSKLRCLSLDFCDGALMESPKGLEVNNWANLRWLRVTGCHQLESLGNKGLPRSLETIYLRDCENLTSLLSSMHNHALLRLEISKCPRLESFGEQGLPHSLQTLFLYDCESLKSLPRSMPSLDSLQEVRIINCGQICLAEDWLPRSLRLHSLTMIDCPGLKSFPTYMDQLNSLNSLVIEGCPQLKSFPDRWPRYSIEILSIINCQNLRSLPNGLPNVMDMTIEGCPQLESFPDSWPPHLIKSLFIRNCQNLRSLPSGLPNDMDLTIEGCPKLQSQP